MGIKPKFTQAEFESALSKKINIIEEAIYKRLNLLGMMCVNEARKNRGYTDRTGNLNASIGYAVVMKGRVMNRSGFQGNMTGIAVGNKELDNAIVSNGSNNNRFALYVVAGMNYASYVEAVGRNVLTSAELFAEKQLPIMMRELSKNIQKL